MVIKKEKKGIKLKGGLVGKRKGVSNGRGQAMVTEMNRNETS